MNSEIMVLGEGAVMLFVFVFYWPEGMVRIDERFAL